MRKVVILMTVVMISCTYSESDLAGLHDTILPLVLDEYGVKDSVGSMVENDISVMSATYITDNSDVKLHDYATTLAFADFGHTIDDYLRPVPCEKDRYQARWRWEDVEIEVQVSIFSTYGSVRYVIRRAE